MKTTDVFSVFELMCELGQMAFDDHTVYLSSEDSIALKHVDDCDYCDKLSYQWPKLDKVVRSA
jgi:uncharacterized Zn-finger protein